MRNKKCKHDKEWTITEWSSATHYHSLSNGTAWHSNHPNNMQSMIRFQCHECNVDIKYSRFALPKWLQKLFDFILTTSDGEEV